MKKVINDSQVSIIILNWNDWKNTIECLESIYQIDYNNYNVIIVDNGSVDGSIGYIKDFCEGKITPKSKFFKYTSENKPIKTIEYTYAQIKSENSKDNSEKFQSDEKLAQSDKKLAQSDEKLTIIKNSINYGYAEGNNIGMRYALKVFNPHYILLLNNDTVVEKDFLKELLRFAEKDKKIGILGPTVYYYDKPNKIAFIGGKINFYSGKTTHYEFNKQDRGQFHEKELDYISGCGLFIRTKTIRDIGLLDPEYFLYYEDIDWSLKARRKGYKIYYVPLAKIWHKISTSDQDRSLISLYYGTRNEFRLMKKNTNLKQMSIFFPFYLIDKLIYSILLAFRGNKGSLIIFRAIYDALRGDYGYKKEL